MSLCDLRAVVKITIGVFLPLLDLGHFYYGETMLFLRFRGVVLTLFTVLIVIVLAWMHWPLYVQPQTVLSSHITVVPATADKHSAAHRDRSIHDSPPKAMPFPPPELVLAMPYNAYPKVEPDLARGPIPEASPDDESRPCE